MESNKIVLGTVQFGVKYGINNTAGQVPLDEVSKILMISNEYGIQTLDTSSAYGTSEVVLGKALCKSSTQFKIVSKFPRCGEDVRNVFEKSIKNLCVNSLYGYLVHHFDFYLEKPEIYDEMTNLKNEGKIKKVGFSLYTVDQLNYLLDKGVKMDILQFPYNIFDKQFEPYIQKLAEMGIEVHTRSAFLQGLFFMDTNSLPIKLKPMKKYLDNLHTYCSNKGLTVEQLALGYVVANPNVKGALIGVDNHEQLLANMKVASIKLSKEDIDYIRNINIKENWLLSPVNWN